MGNRLKERKPQFQPLLSVKESQTDIYISWFFMTGWLGNRPIDLPFEEDCLSKKNRRWVIILAKGFMFLIKGFKGVFNNDIIKRVRCAKNLLQYLNKPVINVMDGNIKLLLLNICQLYSNHVLTD